MNEEGKLRAFAIGYMQGYIEGVYLNPFAPEFETHSYFKRGYDAGVADYSEENEIEGREDA